MSSDFSHDPNWELRRELLRVEAIVLEFGLPEVARRLGLSPDALRRQLRGPGFPTLQEVQRILAACDYFPATDISTT